MSIAIGYDCLQLPIVQKGQMEELIAFYEGIRNGMWPIPLWQQIQATQISLEVERQLNPRQTLNAETAVAEVN